MNEYRPDITRYIYRHIVQCEEEKRTPVKLCGTRRASKTWTVCQYALFDILSNGDVWVVATMTDEQGRLGAYEDCKNIIGDFPAGLAQFYDVAKSPRQITCKSTPNGRHGVIVFKSFQDSETAKGVACDWIFMNEANKFSYQQYLDLAANARKGVILDYNPNQHFWADKLPGDELVCIWQRNKKHLTPSQLQWFKQIYDAAHSPNATAVDRYFYDVYYCGKYSDLAGDIFTPAVIRTCKPEEVPWGELRRPVVFGDPSALVGVDYFPLTLSAVAADGTIYIIDANSTNAGAKAERCRTIERMAGRLDGVRVYIESNGLVGAQFIEYARGENQYEQPERTLAVEGWYSKGNKFDRILAQYETIRDRVVFVERPLLPEYLKQVYAFARKCEHDDNIDNIASVCRLHNFLAN